MSARQRAKALGGDPKPTDDRATGSPWPVRATGLSRPCMPGAGLPGAGLSRPCMPGAGLPGAGLSRPCLPGAGMRRWTAACMAGRLSGCLTSLLPPRD